MSHGFTLSAVLEVVLSPGGRAFSELGSGPGRTAVVELGLEPGSVLLKSGLFCLSTGRRRAGGWDECGWETPVEKTGDQDVPAGPTQQPVSWHLGL